MSKQRRRRQRADTSDAASNTTSSSASSTRTRLPRRVSAPLVLAVSSVLISTGVILGYRGLSHAPTPPTGHGQVRLVADRSSPERVTEAFLDAWIRQQFERALELSHGEAHLTVISRLARHEESVGGVIALESDWDVFVRDPLRLVIKESHRQTERNVVIKGTAEGKLMDQPYRRAMEFLTVQREGQWYVEQMRPGPVLTRLPVITPDHDPAELKMREPP